MSDKVSLPIVPPVYSTYHHQGAGSAIIQDNPSIRNYYLNHVLILKCNQKFLTGFTTPEINIADSSFMANHYIDKKWFDTAFLDGRVSPVIRKLLDDGYYVYFWGVDDYYIPGKSWYHTRHFKHDGLLCGYDRQKKTYDLFAYDTNWKYRVFEIPQRAYSAGRTAVSKRVEYGALCGLRPRKEEVALQPAHILEKLREYLGCTMERFPVTGEGTVYGVAVHDYMAMYLGKLADGSIPHERMDWRIFRVLWEQKTLMLERLKKVEAALEMPPVESGRYAAVAAEMNTLRMLYAAYHMKRRDELLPGLQHRLLAAAEKEREILNEFSLRMEGALKK